jgi:hypothetical protein
VTALAAAREAASRCGGDVAVGSRWDGAGAPLTADEVSFVVCRGAGSAWRKHSDPARRNANKATRMRVGVMVHRLSRYPRGKVATPPSTGPRCRCGCGRHAQATRSAYRDLGRQCRKPSRAATVFGSAARRASATSARRKRRTFGCGLSALGRQCRKPSRAATVFGSAARRASATSARRKRRTFGCGLSALGFLAG